MITESSHSVPPARLPFPPARDGEPCPACGAPLAGDQRYCLHCGTRRPEARLEFLDVLDADVRARQAAAFSGPPAGAAAPYAVAAGPAPAGLAGRLNANAGLLAVAALLVLMLLIGLLLGHWVTDRDASSVGAAAAPAPQVIRVEGTAAPAAATGDTSGGSGDAPSSGSGASSESKSSKAKASAEDDTAAKAPKNAVSVDKLDSKKAVDDAVKKGKPISTGTGKLPPKDDKAPGGGSDFQEIG